MAYLCGVEGDGLEWNDNLCRKLSEPEDGVVASVLDLDTD